MPSHSRAPLRVFAHGSLVFHTGGLDVPAVPARVEGWSRVFGHPSVRNWGLAGRPAPTACLVPGPRVDGMLYELDDPDGSVLAGLRRREASDPIGVTARVEGGAPVPALTWTMTDAWAELGVPALVAAAVHNVASGGGPYGDAWTYVDGITRALGPIDDPHLRSYHGALAAALGLAEGPRDVDSR
jgi:cation transport regulator ChaC